MQGGHKEQFLLFFCFKEEGNLSNVSNQHSPQTSRSAALHACMWEQKWARPACHCSRSWVGRPLLLPIHQPPEVELTAQPGQAPSPRHGSGPPPACGWPPPRSPHFWKLKREKIFEFCFYRCCFFLTQSTHNSRWQFSPHTGKRSALIRAGPGWILTMLVWCEISVEQTQTSLERVQNTLIQLFFSSSTSTQLSPDIKY